MLRWLSIFAIVFAVSAGPPVFPEVWQANTADGIAIFQGGIKNPDGSICCAPTAPQCKVQTVNLNGVTYNDGVNERTRHDSMEGITVNWYGNVMKELALQPLGTGKGFQCVAACPLLGNYSNPLYIKPNAKDKGAVSINGVKAEEWVFYDTLLKVVRMDEKDFFVDMSGGKAAPVAIIEKLTPFDVPIIHPTKELGESATNYSAFSTAALDPSVFDITNCNAQKCDCPPPQQGCNQDSKSDFATQVFKRAGFKQPETLYEKLKFYHKLRKASAEDSNEVSTNGTWAKDWSAVEAAISVIDQGAQHEANGEFCCHPSTGVQCQVQLSSGGGTRYMDFTNQRTRLEDNSGEIGVDDFKTRKSMEVVNNGTHDVCKSYCPIDPEDTLDGGAAFFLDENPGHDFKDLGTTTFEGKTVHEWQWEELLFKIVEMSRTNFYAIKNSEGMYIPLAQTEMLVPSNTGPPLGRSNMTWSAFTPGPQPASKFDIAGADTCPESKNCEAPPLQLRRLRNKQYHTWARYQRMFT
jgi:hypothetical protein